MKKPAEWVCVKEETLLDTPFMKILQRDCNSTDSPSHLHRFYLFKSRDWCNVIPITEDGKVVLVQQYRIGISEQTLEIPGGVADVTDGNIQESALREMTEETGYEALPGARVENLGWTYPNPAIQDNRCHSFVVGPVRRTHEQKLDPAESINVIEVPLEDIPGMILSGQLSHALMLNTFLFLLLRDQEKSKDPSNTLSLSLRRFQTAHP
ncbi:MAG: NUDIX hydrolase [Methylotenera sp.]|nr:NUDIX hydrolase [Oligoflexia bacterium]